MDNKDRDQQEAAELEALDRLRQRTVKMMANLYRTKYKEDE